MTDHPTIGKRSVFFSPPKPARALQISVVILLLYAYYIDSGAGQLLFDWSKTFAPYSIRQYLGMSKRYLLQYGHVVFLFSLLVLSRYIFLSNEKLKITSRFTDWLSQYSLPIFLFHFPLLFCIAAATDYNRASLVDQLGLLTATLISSCLLGRLCFLTKPRFDRWQRWALEKIDARFPRPAALAASSPLQITRSHSEFLNLVKLVAMLCVVLGHFSFEKFNSMDLPGFNGAAPRFAVPTFFMISGYFLMMSIDRSRTGAAAVVAKRSIGLYWVVVPMLLITLILDAIGFRTNASLYEYSDYYVFEQLQRVYTGPEVLAIVANSLLYLNEIWLYDLLGSMARHGGMRAFSNDPFWFMCYLIPFSALLVVGRMVPGRRRYLILAVLCVIIGPPIMMLAPLFLAGSLAYLIHKRWTCTDRRS